MSNSITPGFLVRMTLLPALATVACSQAATPAPVPPAGMNAAGQFNRTVPGSYIVNAPQGEPAIRRLFDRYGVAIVRPLGNDQFEIQLKLDPGLDSLKGAADGSKGAVKSVQPNLIYRAN